MIHRATWAIGIVLLVSQIAFGQASGPEKILPPLEPGIKDVQPQEGGVVLPVEMGPRRPRVYADADYLLWWVNHGPAPILLTTAPNNGANANGLTGGILGEPGTRVLFTGRDLDFGMLSGFRAKVGINLGADDFWSLELGGFALQKKTFNYNQTGNADGTPLLTVPYIDAALGLNRALDINSQDVNGLPLLVGSFNLRSDISFWGYEINAIAHSIRTPERSIDLLFGFRSLRLDENLYIDQTVTAQQANVLTLQFPDATGNANNYLPVPVGSPVFINDTFRARNDFWGGQLGSKFTWVRGAFSADLIGKVALGITHQQISINGSSMATQVDNNGVIMNNVTVPGGVFALKFNSGSFSQNQFTVVPEVNFNLKYDLFSWMRVHVGYGAIYWSNVARPGAQIDPVLNSKLIPTGPFLGGGAFNPGQEQGRPYFNFRDTAFWAHGVNFGVELRY